MIKQCSQNKNINNRQTLCCSWWWLE